MKQLFFQKTHWNSPLAVFPMLKEKYFHLQLFFSGKSEKTSERFSFLVFSEKKQHQKNSEKKLSKKTLKNTWKDIQTEFFIQKKNRKNVPHQWKFPFSGGFAGVFSYDFFSAFADVSSSTTAPKKDIPLWQGQFYDTFFAFDHQKKECFIAGWFHTQKEAENFFQKIFHENPAPSPHPQTLSQTEKGREILLTKKFSPEIDYNQYLKHFKNCQNEIERGNSFQINFSQKFTAKIPEKISSWDIFLHATQKNPAPMMYFYEEKLPPIPPLRRGKENFAIISCSPERLFSCDTNSTIFTQPIAGTRPRGKNIGEEIQYEEELNTSEKEQSEHAMLVDLLRNDFGKVSKFGSVQVINFGRIEKYATVMHLVSDIVGKISPEKNIFDVFEAVFPGGTITGAPKTETMKILEREEISSRNFYCGSAGYFSFCGSSDWNILIRTLEHQGQKISGRAGGGLVWGADPKSEYQECFHKFSGIEKIFD